MDEQTEMDFFNPRIIPPAYVEALEEYHRTIEPARDEFIRVRVLALETYSSRITEISRGMT